MRRTLSVVLGMLMVAAGCGDDGGDDDRAGTPDTSERTTSTTVDEWAVPDEITEAYVQRVLTELYRIQGDALRLAMSEGEVTPDVVALLDDIYSRELAAEYATELNQTAVQGFEDVRPGPGNVVVSDVVLSSTADDCVKARAQLDFNAVRQSPPAPYVSAFALTHTAENATGWLIADVHVQGELSCG